MAIVVGRSADLKLQVVRDDLQTTWKASPQQDSGWTPWQPFPAPAASEDLALPAWALAMTQLPAINPNRELHGNTGRLQLWGLFFNASQPGSEPTRLYSTTKSSEQPNAPWGPWKNANLPALAGVVSGTIAVAYDMAVAQLDDGRLQLWASFTGTGPGQSLWSTVITGPDWNDPWSPWQQFSLPGDPGVFIQLAGVLLPNGNTQLWALGDSLTIYTTTRSASAGAVANPQAGWSSWTPFMQSNGTAFPKARGLQTALDGGGRAYLWAAVIGEVGEPTLQWKYTYSNKWPIAASVAPTWSPLQDQDFPIPAASQNTLNDGGERALSAAALPDGCLQLFYYPQGQQGGAQTVVSTRWQQAGQAPTSWTPWQTPFQP